jgi:hypothetical protein
MVAVGVDTVVAIEDCGGADCDELVHPAQKISIMVIPRIPIIWTGFIGRRSLSMSKMVWLYCKMCPGYGSFISALLSFENPADAVIFPVRSAFHPRDLHGLSSAISTIQENGKPLLINQSTRLTDRDQNF